jgi:hypothetical protein
MQCQLKFYSTMESCLREPRKIIQSCCKKCIWIVNKIDFGKLELKNNGLCLDLMTYDDGARDELKSPTIHPILAQLAPTIFRGRKWTYCTDNIFMGLIYLTIRYLTDPHFRP